MIAHAIRLKQGLPIYAEPSLDFVPFFYTPGYPTLLYILDLIGLDISFLQARSVSLCAVLGTLSLIFYTIKKETASLSFALLGIGFYAALFRTSGAFYDLARPDSLMIFLVMSTVCTVYYSKELKSIVCASLLMSLAFFTKQTAAVFFPVMLGWLLWQRIQAGLIFAIFTLTLCISGITIIDHSTDGAFWTYIFEGHQGHIFHWKNILLKYWRDLIFLAPLTLLLPLLWFSKYNPFKVLTWLLILHWSTAFIQRLITLDYPPHMYYRELFYESPRWLILLPPLFIVGFVIKSQYWTRSFTHAQMNPYWLWIYIAGAGASGLNHSTQWAYSNCFMLIGIAFSTAAPLMLYDLTQSETESSPDSVSPSRPQAYSNTWLWSVVLLQLVAWLYSPNQQLTHQDDLNAWHTLKNRLKQYPTPIFFPAHPTYNALDRLYTEKDSIHTHQMGIRDVAYRGGVADLQATLAPSNLDFRWSAVITHEKTHIPYLNHGYYEANRWRYLSKHSLKAKTGFLTRPQSLWLPRIPKTSARELKVKEATINVNFETKQGSINEQEWHTYGWHQVGTAFGSKPTCTRTWKGEGSCGANSGGNGHKYEWTGRLETSLLLNTHQHLSFLIKAQTQSKSKRAKLEVRMINSQAKVLARHALWADGQWRRILLPQKNQQSSIGSSLIKLQMIDRDPHALMIVDDIKVDVPIDFQ